MTRLYCDGPTLIRAVASAVANLEHHVAEVDALHVFPGPDGDTGSNMLATMRAALAEAQKLPRSERKLKAVADALSRGALTGARGNSGVILSQIIRGMTDGADGRHRASGLDLAQGLRRGSEVAYGSVLMPVEGTILTVIRDAAEAAESAAGQQPHVEAVLAVTIEAAARSVQRTPSLLPVLEDAGVVDSGGQGLFRLLEGTMQIDGRTRRAGDGPDAVISEPDARAPLASADASRALDTEQHAGHGYETEFVITARGQELDIDAIRDALQAVGESIVVAGDAARARVHVHGLRPDLAIGIGVQWGRLGEVTVADLDEQITQRSALAEQSHEDASGAPAGLALVAISDAEGMATTLEGLGARLVRPASGSRPSVGEIAGGILAAGAAEVIVLPNDRDAHLAAGQAASLTPLVAVSVIPTRNAAEGVAAALAFQPNGSMLENAERMELEAGELRSFTVTTAARESVIDGVAVDAGHILALDADRNLLASDDSITGATLRGLAGFDGFDLVTCYYGSAVDAETAAAIASAIRARIPGVEVELIRGGQPHDHLLVAVE